jgi:MFS superfamily sulfate permease-like transporter
MVACGFVYRTPMPVQPMKAAGAIATTQAAQTIVITPAMVWGAGLATGVLWLFLGLTGTARYVSRLIARPVILGIILGLGFSFMIEGAKLMAQNWWVGGAALLGTSLLLTNRIIPAMFLLLVFGAAYGILSDPTLFVALSEVHMELRLPTFVLSTMTFHDFLFGTLFLALRQVPLTLGNAIIAISEENNRLFPDREVNEGKISISTGLMNILSAAVGGVPMCHGAGGMAGHVRFGARTGGALIILGLVLLATALLFSGSVTTFLRLFPPSLLGIILFLTGAQLALGACDIPKDKGERFALIVTAALEVWNVGIAFVVGLAACWLNKRDLLRV